MKCVEVEQALWSGEVPEEYRAHIASCASCQNEMMKIGAIVESMQSISVPPQSRSLLPSRTVIRQVVQQNRRKPWARYSYAAASIAIVLGVATGIGLHQMQQTENPAAPVNTSTLASVAPTASNQEFCKIIADYLNKTVKAPEVKHITINNFQVSGSNAASQSKNSSGFTMEGLLFFTVNLSPNVPSLYTDGAQKTLVTLVNTNGQWSVKNLAITRAPSPLDAFVDVAPGANAPDVCDRIKVYLQRNNKGQAQSGVNPLAASGVKHLRITGFSADPAQTEQRAMVGRVTMVVDLMPNTASPYNEGENIRFVLLTKQQGIWEVEKMAESPLSLADAPAGDRDFSKAAQKLQGIILDVQFGSSQGHNNMEPLRWINYIDIRVEKNLTVPGAASPTWKAGETVRVQFDPLDRISSGSPLTLDKGYRVILETAPSDPRITAGDLIWFGKIANLYVERGGQYYDATGHVVTP